MRPLRYMDIELPPANRGAGIPAPVIASRAMQVLHAHFSAEPATYALALPGWGDPGQSAPGYPWRALRVFAEDMDALDRLMAAVGNHPVIRDYTRAGFPRPLPPTFDGIWVEYRRYRISSRKAGVDELRHRRLAAAMERELPFFQMRSASNTQAFILTVDPRPADPPADPATPVAPDSYGLSVASRAFALPHIPLD